MNVYSLLLKPIVIYVGPLASPVVDIVICKLFCSGVLTVLYYL